MMSILFGTEIASMHGAVVEKKCETSNAGQLFSFMIKHTVEPCLSDPRLSVPSIIRNDIQNFLIYLNYC